MDVCVYVCEYMEASSRGHGSIKTAGELRKLVLTTHL